MSVGEVAFVEQQRIAEEQKKKRRRREPVAPAWQSTTFAREVGQFTPYTPKPAIPDITVEGPNSEGWWRINGTFVTKAPDRKAALLNYQNRPQLSAGPGTQPQDDPESWLATAVANSRIKHEEAQAAYDRLGAPAFGLGNPRETKRQLEEDQAALARFQEGKIEAMVEATRNLERAVQTVPKSMLREGPYTTIYLAALSDMSPAIIPGASEAWQWLEARWGMLKGMKGNSAISKDKRNRVEFNKWAEATVNEGIEHGRLPKELTWEQLDFRGQNKKVGPLTWHVNEEWANAYPHEFFFLMARVKSNFPGVKIELAPSVYTEEEKEAEKGLKAQELDLAREEAMAKASTFEIAMMALGDTWDVATSPFSFLARYINEGSQFLSYQDTKFPSPTEVYKDVLPAFVRHPELIFKSDVAPGTADYDQMLSLFEEDQREAGLRFTNQFAPMFNYEISDPEWQSNRLWLAFFTDFLLSYGVGGYMRGLKMVGQKGFSVEQTLTRGLMGRERLVRRALVDPSLSKNWITKEVVARMGIAPEEFLKTKQGTRVVESLERMKNLAVDTQQRISVGTTEFKDLVRRAVGTVYKPEIPVGHMHRSLLNNVWKERQWGIISGGAANEDLGLLLRKRGFDPIDMTHKGEASWFVPGLSSDELVELGQRYKQGSVLSPEGLISFEKTGGVRVKKLDFSATKYDDEIPGLKVNKATGEAETADVPFSEIIVTDIKKPHAQARTLRFSFETPTDEGTVLGGNIASRILDRFGRYQMTAEDAALLARAKNQDEIKEILISGMRGGGRPARFVTRDKARLKEIRSSLSKSPEIEESLLAEKEFLEGRLRRDTSASIISEFPKADFVRDAVRGYEDSRFGRFLLHMSDERFGPSILRLDRAWEELPGSRIVSPFHPTAKGTAAAEEGFENIQRFLKRTGVNDTTRHEIGRMWLEMRHSDDLFDVMKAMGEAVEVSSTIDPLVAREIARFFHTKAEDMRRGVVETIEEINGRRVSFVDDTLSYTRSEFDTTTQQMVDRTYSLPAFPTELIQGIPLPSYKDIVQATSIVHNMIRKAGPIGKPFEWALTAVDAASFFWKRAILTAKLPTSLPLRVQGEQAFRLAAFDYNSLVSHPFKWMSSLRGESDFAMWAGRDVQQATDAFLGAMVRNWADEYGSLGLRTGPLRRTYRPQDGPQFYKAWANKLLFRSTDPVARIYARRGKEGLAVWLKNNRFGKEVADTMQSTLDRAGVSMDEWIDRVGLEIDQITGGVPDLKRALYSGKFDRDITDVEDIMDFRAHARDARRNVQDFNERLRNGEKLTQAERRQRILLLDQLNANKLKTKNVVNMEDVNDVAVALEDMDVRSVLHAPAEVAGDILQVEPGWKAAFRGRGARRVSDFLFRNFYSNPDLYFSRRPLMRQIAKQQFDRYVRLGMTQDRAAEAATKFAAHRTSDLLYDLSMRTSGQFFMRNVSPFFPAWQELMTTWAWRIPVEMGGPGLGHAMLARRTEDLVNLAKATGVIQSNERGEDIVVVPFVGDMLEKFLGYKGDIQVAFTLKGLNMVFAGLFGLGPLSSIAVAQAAKRFGGVAEVMADFFLPYGLEISVGPTSVNRMWAAVTGDIAPWEWASKGYQEMLWDHTVEDGAVMARSIVGPPPQAGDRMRELQHKKTLDDTETAELTKLEKKLDLDKDQWLEQITAEAQNYARTYYLAKGLSSMLLPAVVQITPDYVAEKTAFWKEFNLVTDSAKRSKMFDDFLADHPQMSWALMPKTVVAPGQERSGFVSEGQDEGFDRYLQDLREGRIESLDPETFVQLAYAQESYRDYLRRRRVTIQKYGSAANLLKDMGGYWGEIADISLDWENFQTMNPEAIGLMEQVRRDSALGKPNLTAVTTQVERLQEFSRDARSLAEYFTDEFGVKLTDYKAILSVMSDTLGPKEYGPARTDIEKDLEWWWSEQGRPFFDKKGAIIDNMLGPGGLPKADQGPFWDKIRRMANDEKHVVSPFTGKRMPTPEEVSWGMMSPEEQQFRRLKLSSRRPEWLTRFERGKIGLSTERKIDKFVDVFTKDQDALYSWARKNSIHTSSTEFKNRQEAFDGDMKALAKKLDVTGFLSKMDQPIFERINALPNSPVDSKAWKWTTQAARAMRSIIESRDLSPSGNSELAQFYYNWFTDTLNTIRRREPKFDEEMLRMESVMDLNGRDMYLAVYFGLFPR